ncbi:MAG: hypothetical protein HY554_01670 [Elusimicrobia bacterium]|nr:hypothetical protein [Elusimicrobiota bacterium]
MSATGGLASLFLACGALAGLGPERFPNDAGPAELDVSGYPEAVREGYRLAAFKCAACHTAARPFNSEFLELSPKEESALRKLHPELGRDRRLVRIEAGVWSRYVRRMMAKPGSPVKSDDGKKIWSFLRHDSKVRKTGANAKAWARHRGKLLGDFARKQPAAYRQRFGDAPPPDER